MGDAPELIASYWTLAGNISPFGATAVSPHSFRARVETASRAGYRGIGLYYDDLMHNVAQLGYEQMSAILRDNGIKFFEIEALLDWFTDGDRRSRSDAVRYDMLRAAERLDVYQIKIAGDLNGEWPVAGMVEPYAQLCEEAAEAGTRVSLEILPFSNIKDVITGLAVVGDVSIANGGLLFDLWHMVRGAVSFAEIAEVPLQFVAGVELDDGPFDVVEPLLQECIDRRVLCGEGDFDIPGFLACLEGMGYSGPFGVEILSDENRARSLEDAARLTFDTTLSQFPR